MHPTELHKMVPALPDSEDLRPPFYEPGMAIRPLALTVKLPNVAWAEIARYAAAEELSVETAVAVLAQEAAMDWNNARRIRARCERRKVR